MSKDPVACIHGTVYTHDDVRYYVKGYTEYCGMISHHSYSTDLHADSHVISVDKLVFTHHVGTQQRVSGNLVCNKSHVYTTDVETKKYKIYVDAYSGGTGAIGFSWSVGYTLDKFDYTLPYSGNL